ncbi:hypothetical protein PRZ48_000792 [Zasmidium cellare]|uniref:Uncharacterized protein n=1 Tax=Zasmidium cellare TaxID=395010 RepID=A0ABR0F135_ZASCE|nr:hypothetical protein PRZ48_000792 [Zasmidium cellare]
MRPLATILSAPLLFSSHGFALVARKPAADVLLTDINNAPSKPPEGVHCYNSGVMMNRTVLIAAIDPFCDQLFHDGGLFRNDAAEQAVPEGAHHIIVSAQPKGCSAIDADLMCKVLLRLPIDDCNTEGVGFKQGGTVETECAIWRVDPNKW